ncbi:MAG: DegT/DnrJ/EryC1/StrS family aminotransferase [Clostridium sp.]
MNILFSPPDIGEDEIAEVVDTLRSGWITTGPKTKKFEQEIAQFCHTNKAVCLNSQTAAAELTLHVLGIGPGDEVIVPAYTYTATCSVVCHVGAIPVMIDCAPGSYEMDYDQLEAAITEKTKCIIPVDIAGIVCDYNRIFAAVEAKKQLFHAANTIQEAFGRVIVMADSAHAFGAQWHGKMCGEIADFTNFSFHAVKNLTTGEGGAVTWRDIPGIDNEVLYKEYMLLSLHGQSKDALAKTQLGAWEYDVVAPYYKCNMTDIMASLGLAQLHRYPAILTRRQEIIHRYNKAFSDLPIEVLQHKDEMHCSSGHLYLVRLIGHSSDYRNATIIKMAEQGVACNVHYKPLPMHTAYKTLGFDIKDYPNAYAMYENEITLPLHTCLTDDQVEYVINQFCRILRGEGI